LAAKVGERYEVYQLLVLFMAHTGLRAAEVQGLEVRDETLTTGPDETVRGSVRVQRTKTRRNREWVTGTPKSKTSKRTVPLPPWLAMRLATYLADTHPFADTPTAVLWPRRLHGN
jgi:integrase